MVYERGGGGRWFALMHLQPLPIVQVGGVGGDGSPLCTMAFTNGTQGGGKYGLPLCTTALTNFVQVGGGCRPCAQQLLPVVYKGREDGWHLCTTALTNGIQKGGGRFTLAYMA